MGRQTRGGGDDGYVEVDPVSALGATLSRLDGRVSTLADLAGSEPLLVAVVERDCPTSRGALRALADVGGRVAVLSQGRAEAAHDLAATTGTQHLDVLVEPAPHKVSEALDVRTVPTFVLFEDLDVAAHLEGWDRSLVAPLVVRAGGGPIGDGGLPELKPGCGSRSTFDDATLARLERDDAALGRTATDGSRDGDDIDEMWRRGWHDGLPVVPPTPGRVEAMLDGRDPTTPLGVLGPVMAEVTFERLAVCAVLAGCEPRTWPVIEAAARAVLDPAFNAHGVTNTTHFASPWLIVNGPVRERVGMHAGSNALGPGNRANATIGRAIRLLLQLTGGGSPGGLDRATLGGPHKYTACFPEHEEASPWEPLHVTLGHDDATSTVTVYGGEAPAGVSDHSSRTADALATTLSLAMANAWSPTWFPIGTQTLLVLCPEHATTFGEAGWSKQRLRETIVERTTRSVGRLRSAGSGELTPEVMDATDPDRMIPKFASEREVVVVVAGADAGRFSAVIGPWVGFGLGSTMVTKEIET